MKDTLNAALEVLNFLYGVGDLEGAGFGDKPPGERSEYWWRKHLCKIHDALAPAAATSAQWAMCPETGTPCSNCPTKRAACEAAAAPDVWVTDAMVTDYLEANDRYWLEKDAMPRSLTKWRNGTPREATRVSLIAALAAPAQGAKPVDGDALLQDGMTNEDLRKAWHSKLRNVVPTDRELSAFALGIEVGAERRPIAATPQPPDTGTEKKA